MVTRAPHPRSALCVGIAFGLLALSGCATNGAPSDTGPQRHIALEGTMNTRDLGGYRTEDGRQVKWGQLYRSDDLSKLERPDIDTLAKLHLKVVHDLRTDYERTDAEDRLPVGVRLYSLAISFPSMDPRVITSRILSGDASEQYFQKMLVRANRSFALDHGAELAELVRALAASGGLPALFHCTYGKDRTGFAAAMVLEILGVPWETVIEDYLLSNVYLGKNISSMSRLIRMGSVFRISKDDARALLGVDRSYLDSARQAILDEHGSLEAYHAAIGLDEGTLEHLRAVLLEPIPDEKEADEEE